MASGLGGGGRSPATRWLGVEVVSEAPGAAVVAMPARSEMANRAGVVHGGFIALLADSAMGRAMGTRLEAGQRHQSFDLKVSFIAPGQVGERLTAAARVLHRGRRTGVCDCRLEGTDGRLVATATATFMLSAAGAGQS